MPYWAIQNEPVFLRRRTSERSDFLVRRYQQLLEEIKHKQRFTKAEWTQKTIDALLGALTIIDKKDTARITYQEWREWQEQLAKQNGWEGPEETETKPLIPRLKKTTG